MMTKTTTYQSHDGSISISDSNRKLMRIGLPQDLTNKSVLDIGCNEGVFCAVAAQRGASAVIGIDSSETSIKFAKDLYRDAVINFECRSWRDLPSGLFDFVLWLSAMHYESDPLLVFRNIASRLSAGGLFILECGIYPYAREALYQLPIGRHDCTPVYPTFQFLESQLSRAGFTFRLVADGEETSGDKVPRFVYHCTKRLPTVLLLRGRSQTGKSSLALLLRPAASKVIQLDGLIELLSMSEFTEDPIYNYLNECFDKDNLEPVFDGIDRAGITSNYVGFISRAISVTDELVVVEGYMTDVQAVELRHQLDGNAVIWDVTTLNQLVRDGLYNKILG